MVAFSTVAAGTCPSFVILSALCNYDPSEAAFPQREPLSMNLSSLASVLTSMRLPQLNRVLRRLGRAPMFTAVTLITLAVAVGANTAAVDPIEALRAE